MTEPRAESYYCWREFAKVEGEDNPRLLIPWSDPSRYEFPVDAVFDTSEAAELYRENLLEGYDEDDETYQDAMNWVLCTETIKPVGHQEKVIEAISSWLESNDIEPEQLDDLVHDVASRPASGANNGGLYGQVEFLLEMGVTEHEIADVLGLTVRCEFCMKRVSQRTIHTAVNLGDKICCDDCW